MASSLYDTMAGQGPTSPFIKNEPDDMFDPNRFAKSPDAFGQPGSAHYGPWHGSGVDGLGMDINPAALSQPMSTSQNLPSSFVPGGSAITDDELLSSFNVNAESHQQNGQLPHQHQNGIHQFQSMNGMTDSFQRPVQQNGNHPQQMNGFSSTPDGAPIQSPFDRGNFDFGQWQTVNHQGQLATPVSGGFGPNSMQDGQGKPSMTQHMNGMQLGTSPTNNFSPQTVSGRTAQHGRQSSLCGQWDNSLGSGQSHMDSPLSSPGAPMHAQITEVLKSGTPVSPPARGKATTTAEMKKAKRRASHNEVERRRRNHINDRINELAELVPKHRLEDDAVRRSVMSNAAMPLPLGGHSMSPPATSGLASNHGRRAASISQGAAAADDKDKGPAKGDVLDGTVDWTRDLLWLVNSVLSRQNEMEHTINSLSGPQARPYSDDEKRMLSEVQDAIQKNRIADGQYTRRHGTNLYVPKFTNHAGEPVESPSVAAVSPPSVFDLDPTQTVNSHVNGGQYLWNSSAALKEEEELLDFEMS